METIAVVWLCGTNKQAAAMTDNTDNALYQLIYTSLAQRDFTADDLRRLLPRIRENNAKHGLTGVLLFDESEFFQVLEGPKNKVLSVFEHIANSRQHSCLVIQRQGPIPKRAFGDWSMGYASMSVEDLLEDDGMNDFYVGGKSYSEMKPGWEKVLLTSFMRGKWPIAIA